MKKIIFAIAALLTAARLFAIADISNELSASQGYLSYSLSAATEDEPFSVNGNLSLSGSSGHNSTFGAGAGCDFDPTKSLSLTLNGVYNVNNSYPVFGYDYTAPVTLKEYVLSYKQSEKSFTLTPGLSDVIGFFTISPSCDVAFNDLAGILEVKPDATGINRATTISEQYFDGYNPGVDMSFKLPENFKIKIGGTRNYYDIDVTDVLDATGSTLTANRQDRGAAALKSAVTFNDYDYTGEISKRFGNEKLDLSFQFTKMITPTYQVAAEHEWDVTLGYTHDFSKYFDMGLKLEGVSTVYTDQSVSKAGYIYLDIDFNRVGGENKKEEPKPDLPAGMMPQ
ncbi:MAG: hypothetical protein ABSA34_00785 [Candidatus Goldiibacteriota bacterium]|jgi:hypothetical protein